MARIKVLWLSFLALLLSNCENPVITDDDRMEPQGNLKVSIYQIEQTPFSALTRAESGIACSRLNFIVYDESGSRLNQVSQKVEEPGFGTTAFQLEEGIYQLVVVGHSASGNPTTTNLSKIQFTNGNIMARSPLERNRRIGKCPSTVLSPFVALLSQTTYRQKSRNCVSTIPEAPVPSMPPQA